jgi:hypothetical protein
MTTIQTEAQNIHGIAFNLPSEWSNYTVYQFAAPIVDSIEDDAVRLRAKTKPKTKFRDNLVVTKHTIPEDLSLEKFFEPSNEGIKQRSRDFKIIGSGKCALGQRTAYWQEVSFFEPSASLLIYQRATAIQSTPTQVVLFTLTSDQNKLVDIFHSMGFASPGGRA